jgi:hypothetical protein
MNNTVFRLLGSTELTFRRNRSTVTSKAIKDPIVSLNEDRGFDKS